MSIRHDISDESIVTICTECGYWSAFSWTRAEAFTVGEMHLINVHGISQEAAANARRQYNYRRRHAENKQPVTAYPES